jgi:hypothetical protein
VPAVEICSDDHLEHIADFGVVVDNVSYIVDQADDLFGHPVSGSCLAREDHRAGYSGPVGTITQAVVAGDQVQNVE